jgi:hypothetical protein
MQIPDCPHTIGVEVTAAFGIFKVMMNNFCSLGLKSLRSQVIGLNYKYGTLRGKVFLQRTDYVFLQYRRAFSVRFLYLRFRVVRANEA